MKKHIFIAIFLTLILLFKPITIYIAEECFSTLLKKNVEFISFTISPLRATAIIGDKQDTIRANVITLFPLKVKANYDGNIDAFSAFHQPFSAPSRATATITYDEEFVVKGVTYLYGSKTDVVVKKLHNGWKDWSVYTDTSKLHVDKFLDFKTYKDIILDMKLKLNILKQDDIYYLDYAINALPTIPNYELVSLDSNGTYEDKIIKSSSLHVKMKNKDISLEDLMIDKLIVDTQKLIVALHTNSLGGDLDASYKDGILDYDGKNLHLSKLLKITKQKPLAKGYTNFKGKLNTKTITTDFSFNSPKIFTTKQEVKNLNIKVKDLKYTDKKLTSSYVLDVEALDRFFTCKGELNYTDILDFTAKTDMFDSQILLHVEDKNFKLNAKDLNITQIEKFVSISPALSGLVNVDLDGNFDKFSYIFNAKTNFKHRYINIKSDGMYDIKSKILTGDFNATTPLKNNALKIKGTLKYAKDFKLVANSSAFDSNTLFKLNNNKFEFFTNHINLEKLSSAFELKPLYGYLDIKARSKSSYKDIDFSIYSDSIKRNMLIENIDNALEVNLTGNYTPKRLRLKDSIRLIYKKENIPISVDAHINLLAPYKSKASFSHNKDKVLIKSFSYENEQIKSDFEVDISQLHKYRNLTQIELHGPILINGKQTKTLNITSSSLGGNTHINIDKNLITAQLEDLNISKISALFAEEKHIHNGTVNGNITYNLKADSAKTDIKADGINLSGIDINELLSTLNNALGLDVISITRSYFNSKIFDNKKQTDIKYLQLNLSLKDKNIYLDDVAFATQKFRLAALGDIKDNGDIKNLNFNILDKNGCAIITQDFNGNIKSPNASQRTTAIVSVAKHIPSSIFGTGKKILDFAAETVDTVATTGTQILGSKRDVSIVSNINNLSTTLLSSTAEIIIPQGCKVVYDGEIKHPVEVGTSKKRWQLSWR